MRQIFLTPAARRCRRALIHQVVSVLFLGACGAVILINLDPLSIVWR